MTLFPVLVDIYLKEQLVTKEEAEEVAADRQRWHWLWVDIAVTKDSVTATRIADILDKHDVFDVPRYIRGSCVYCCLCV